MTRILLAIVVILGIGAGIFFSRHHPRGSGGAAPGSASSGSEVAAPGVVGDASVDAGEEPALRAIFGSGDSPASAERFRETLLAHAREGLVRRSAGAGVEPGAATAWEKSDLGVWTFHLRPDLKWSDGSTLTANDFVGAWRRRAAARSAEDSGILTAVAKDPQTLTVTVAQATSDSAVLLALAGPGYAPLSGSGDASDSGSGAADEMRGPFNGAFTLATREAAWVLRKNPYYWALAQTGIDALEVFATGATGQDVLADFAANKIAFAAGMAISRDELPKVAMNVRQMPSGRVVVAAVNRSAPSMGNKALRMALRGGINREDLAMYTDGGKTLAPMRGLVPPSAPGVKGNYGSECSLVFDANPRTARDDFAKAKKELGGKFPKAIRVLAADEKANQAELAHLVAWFKNNYQVELALKFAAADELDAALKKGAFDLYYARVDAGSEAPLAYLKAVVVSTPFASLVKISPDAAKKIAQADKAIEPREQLDLVGAAERAIVDDGVVIGVGQESEAYLLASGLYGIVRRSGVPDPDFTRAQKLPDTPVGSGSIAPSGGGSAAAAGSNGSAAAAGSNGSAAAAGSNASSGS